MPERTKHLSYLSKLCRIQAVERIASFAFKDFWLEVALIRVLYDTILDPVKLVTLLHDFIMNQSCPCGRLDEIRRVERSGNGEEAPSPCDQVIEV
jgi:hypothetical protein